MVDGEAMTEVQALQEIAAEISSLFWLVFWFGLLGFFKGYTVTYKKKEPTQAGNNQYESYVNERHRRWAKKHGVDTEGPLYPPK